MPSSSEPGAPGLDAGLRATVRAVVTEADTAEAMGSGELPVLATPRLLALAEAGVAVRRLELRLSPLESMFFALTTEGECDADEHAELIDRAFLRS